MTRSELPRVQDIETLQLDSVALVCRSEQELRFRVTDAVVHSAKSSFDLVFRQPGSFAGASAFDDVRLRISRPQVTSASDAANAERHVYEFVANEVVPSIGRSYMPETQYGGSECILRGARLEVLKAKVTAKGLSLETVPGT